MDDILDQIKATLADGDDSKLIDLVKNLLLIGATDSKRFESLMNEFQITIDV